MKRILAVVMVVIIILCCGAIKDILSHSAQIDQSVFVATPTTLPTPTLPILVEGVNLVPL